MSKADSLQIELLSANVVGTAIGMLMLKWKAHYFNSGKRSLNGIDLTAYNNSDITEDEIRIQDQN
ncbi:MAG: hypothetical protein XD58_0787 [Thermotoga sp. 50_1627]|nr:MAG: hypothetical protein XD45_0906 [Thermotoga sp. 50_64]KUK25279.1 MAG: hypothetical protein XD58_0787 [Thermotoga sp. 50_1627]MDK2922692.1 hypothetical protein [Pseudothermotoga sp.]HBT38666.1 hypothetical protein [Pseudothermotoga sp.]HCO98179.1 hypothetical protein [Pseudothermotoga sp.]